MSLDQALSEALAPPSDQQPLSAILGPDVAVPNTGPGAMPTQPCCFRISLLRTSRHEIFVFVSRAAVTDWMP